MISDTFRFIFVHINKTGGTSVEKIFEPQAGHRDVRYKHAAAAFYKEAFPDQFREYFKFAFVRNPWDWLVSRYHWSRDQQRLFEYGFHEFLWRLNNRIRLSAGAPWLEDEALRPQLDRLTIGGAIGVDFVGRFENLQSDFDKICSNLRIEPRTLQHLFKTNHAHYAEYYDGETRRIVERLYAADIAAFGYGFDDLPRSMQSTSVTGDNNVIRTFWHGSDLTAYERLALSSFVKLGHAVQLFSYHSMSPIPGVDHVDAASILPEQRVFSYGDGHGKGSFAAFANVFRYKMLHVLGGTWVDADVLCLRPMWTLPSACVGWQDDALINNAIMRFPPRHFITKELYERAEAAGRNVTWGQTGPELLTDVARRHSEHVAIMARETFYPVHWTNTWKLLSADEGDSCEAVTSESYCVHWWNSIFRQMNVRKDRAPPVGSYLHRRAREILGEHAFDAWPAADVDTGTAKNLASPRRPWAPGAWTQHIANPGTFEFIPMRSAGADGRRVETSRLQNAASAKSNGIRVERLKGNPIIRPAMLPGTDGNNINGPSLIKAPAWIERPLGRYYLYFAHHEGKYIRLAYADELAGPWTVYHPGTLGLANTPCDAIQNPIVVRNKHLASPDVHVDDQERRIRMYFHGPVHASGPVENENSYKQLSLVATSNDGLQFEAYAERLGNPYFRVFRWNDAWYALGMPGVVYRSFDGLTGFVEGPTLFTPNMRHSAVRVDGATLQVFYSVVGENPERILISTIDLSLPWMEWRASKPDVVLEPQMDWEGAALPARPSVRGIARGLVRELRDPAIFVDAGRTYLLYSVAGESGIAIGELHLP